MKRTTVVTYLAANQVLPAGTFQVSYVGENAILIRSKGERHKRASIAGHTQASSGALAPPGNSLSALFEFLDQLRERCLKLSHPDASLTTTYPADPSSGVGEPIFAKYGKTIPWRSSESCLPRTPTTDGRTTERDSKER